MTFKEFTDAEKQAYMDFWGERKPESFALEAWSRKMAIILREFRPNPSGPNSPRENRNISKYTEFFSVIFRSDAGPASLHGIHDGMSIIKSHLQFIHKHEKRGTSLVAVSAIADRLSEVETLFKIGAQENNWNSVIAGEKLLREPLTVESFAPYDKYSWLKDCQSAQDVAATLWTNFFSRFLNDICQKESSYGAIFNLGLISPFGTEPRFTIDMPLGAASPPSNFSFQDIVAEANACIPKQEKRFPKDLYLPEVADGIKNRFIEKAQSFIDKFAPNLHTKPGFR